MRTNNQTEICRKNGERKLSYDFLRILATFFVIMIHVISHCFNSTSPLSTDHVIFVSFYSVIRVAVPIFVMISGALFLDPKRNISVGDIYKKYILRIVTAYVFWSLVYAIYNYENPKTFIKELVTGGLHMWFLPMIAALYMLVPLLRKITESRRLTEYFLIIAFVFTFLISFALDFSALAEMKEKYESMFHFSFTLGFSPYFLLGHYISEYEIKKKHRIILYCAGAAAIAVNIVTALLLAGRGSEDAMMFMSNLSPTFFVESAALFTLAKHVTPAGYKNEKAGKVVSLLSKLSFGVYLSHVLVLNMVEKLTGLTALSFFPPLAILLLSLITFVISLMISLLISFIPVLKKYVI